VQRCTSCSWELPNYGHDAPTYVQCNREHETRARDKLDDSSLDFFGDKSISQNSTEEANDDRVNNEDADWLMETLMSNQPHSTTISLWTLWKGYCRAPKTSAAVYLKRYNDGGEEEGRYLDGRLGIRRSKKKNGI